MHEEIRFIYNNEYYEYGKEEMSAYLYEDELPKPLVKLLSDRAFIIDRVANYANTIKNEGEQVYDNKEIDAAIDAVYRTENDISVWISENNIQLEWYHPTNPKKEWKTWEEQRAFLCMVCGAIYDLGTPLLVEKNGHFVSECPKCKSDKLALKNKYLCLGEKLQEEGYRLYDQGELEKSIDTRKQELEQLQRVDTFYTEVYERAIYRQICAYGDIAMIYYQMGNMQEANEQIEKAILYSQILLGNGKMERFSGTLADIYNCRMNIRINLPNYEFDDIFSDYKETIKYNTENLNNYKNYTENLDDISEQEKSNVFKTIENLRLKTYSSLIAYCVNNHRMDRVRLTLEELKAYLSTCKYMPENELRKYKEMTDETLQELQGPRNEGCYIATAVYGDYDAPQVIILRKFRDTVLQESLLGRLFIKMYYKYSPPVAARLEKTMRINSFVRKILDIFIEKIEK